MTKRRSRGDGGLHWDEKRQRWIATANLGFDPSGKRIVKRGSGRTKTEAKNKLKEVLRDHEDGLAGDVLIENPEHCSGASPRMVEQAGQR